MAEGAPATPLRQKMKGKTICEVALFQMARIQKLQACHSRALIGEARSHPASVPHPFPGLDSHLHRSSSKSWKQIRWIASKPGPHSQHWPLFNRLLLLDHERRTSCPCSATNQVSFDLSNQ